MSSWNGAVRRIQQQLVSCLYASENQHLGGGPRCQGVPGFADDQECLQVQRWSAEQLGKATDEELWEASLCVVLKVHQFFATETARQGMCVLQKRCSIYPDTEQRRADRSAGKSGMVWLTMGVSAFVATSLPLSTFPFRWLKPMFSGSRQSKCCCTFRVDAVFCVQRWESRQD